MPRKFFLEPPDIYGFSELRRSEVSFDIQFVPSKVFFSSVFELHSLLWLYHDTCHSSKSEPFLPGSMQIKLVTLCRDKCLHYPTPSTRWFAFEARTQAISWLKGKSFAIMLNLQNRPPGKYVIFHWKAFSFSRLVGCSKPWDHVKCLGQSLSGWGAAVRPGSVPGVRQMMVPWISNIREPAAPCRGWIAFHLHSVCFIAATEEAVWDWAWPSSVICRSYKSNICSWWPSEHSPLKNPQIALKEGLVHWLFWGVIF